ncbi:MAG: T9SS type A sorting domain-containing protein, partial [Ignavibacteria bacterium]|nr:T9SS type A sorting domain-containing protein [Ignavibacteria bacterium]
QFGQGPESYSLFKTTNGGSNWINIISNLNTDKVYSLNFLNANTGFAVIDSLRFLKTTDSGNSWNIVSYLPVHTDKLFMIDELNGYAIDLIDFYRTTDGGITWVLQNLNLNISSGYSKISFINPQLGYVVGRNGLILKTTTGGTVFVNNNSQTVNDYYLSQNYPNPFNPETKIQFSIPKSGQVKIVVYDLIGREVKELVNEFKQIGSYNISFNGVNLSSGIYFYKLITDDFIETKKMILVK